MNAQVTPERKDDDALAAEYALGVLPHGERLAFARRLEGEADLREKVRFWDEHFSALSEAIEPVTPPARIREQLEQSLFATVAPRTG
jgi:anti-sigma-K factor RskA